MRNDSVFFDFVATILFLAAVGMLAGQGTTIGVRNPGAMQAINAQLSSTAPGSAAHQAAQSAKNVQMLKDAQDAAAEVANNRRENAYFYREHTAAPAAASKKLSAKELAELEVFAAVRVAGEAGRYEEALQKIDQISGADRDLGILKFKA